MNKIKQRTARVSQLEHDIKMHPICYHLEKLPGKYRVIFPTGFRFDGVQCSTDKGKAAALERLIERCEEEWRRDLYDIWGQTL